MSGLEEIGSWRLSTPGGIKFRLKDQVGSFSEEGSEVTLTVIIQSGDLLDFVLESFPVPFISGGNLTYPQRLTLGGLPSLVSKRVSFKGLTDGLPIDPFGSDSGAPSGTYEQFLEVQITFSTAVENDTGRDPNNPFTFLEVSASASGEFLSAPIRGEENVPVLWTLETGDTFDPEHRDLDIPQPVTQVLIGWTLNWTQIPFNFYNNTLMSRLREKMGKVNDSDMPIFTDAPAETILFMGFSTRQQFTWRTGNTGASPIALTMNFLEKNFETEIGGTGVQVTHNHMYRSGTGWRKLTINGNPLHADTDMNEIFDP